MTSESALITLALAASDQDVNPVNAPAYDDPHTYRLIRLCRELQRRAGDEPFALSGHDVAAALGVAPMVASRRLRVLVVDEVLTIAEAHVGVRATRYRYCLA